MCPRVSRISEDSRTASLKSLVTEVSAARNRLPKLWPSSPDPFDETMLKQAGEQGLVFRESDDAVANVSRRKHVELLAQTSAGAAVVADRDHGAEFADFRLAGCCQGAGTGDVALESLEQGGQAGAAADGDDAQAAVDDALARGGRGARRWASGTATASHCPQGSLIPGRTQPPGRDTATR